MPTITKKMAINAPLSKVFNFVTDPQNWTKYVTSLIDVKDISSEKIEKGTTFKWTYRMLGINFNGRGYITEFIKNKRFGMKMEGSFPITESYEFEKIEDGTGLSVKIEYDMPKKIINIVEQTGIIEKLNKKESEAVLTKIKLLCEAKK